MPTSSASVDTKSKRTLPPSCCGPSSTYGAPSSNAISASSATPSNLGETWLYTKLLLPLRTAHPPAYDKLTQNATAYKRMKTILESYDNDLQVGGEAEQLKHLNNSST